MTPNIRHFPASACAIAASLLVAACGGGGASAPDTVAGSSGFAVDGYLRGATILCDVNGNGEADAGEVSVTTDTSGFFRFDRACASALVVTGGTSIDTSIAFGGKLKAPPGSTMVTPLTTLMSNGMTLDNINTALNLPLGTDVTQVDPARSIGGVYQNADLFRKTLAIQQILQKIAETLANVAGAGANAVLPAIYSEAAAGVASRLRTNPVLLSGNTIDTAALTALIQAATTRVASSAILSTEIKAGLAAVNAASLAEVMAGALKVQTDSILASSNSLLVSTTATAQLDTRIADFALQNKTALGEAPGPTITSLASTLADTVNGGVAPPPPPPPTTGTVLISWDEATLPATNIGAFGDASPTVAAAPAGGSGNALKLDRSGTQNFGGTYFNVPAVPFAADRKTITARVYATRANAVVYLKVEVPGGAATEVPATVTAANTWQTLTWDLGAVSTANSYTVMVFSADTNVNNLGAQTYWIDDVTLAAAPTAGPAPAPSANCATVSEQCISFSESTVAALGFEGLISATVTDDPALGAANKVLRLVKGPSGQPWAGATVYTMGTPGATPEVLTIDTVGLATSKLVTLRSYNAAPVGTKVTLKLENAIDPGQNILAETVTTVQNAWETLTFNFASPSAGVYSANTVYNKASIFPAFDIPGAQAPLTVDTAFFFDELKYAVVASAPPPPPPPPPPAPPPAPGVCTAPNCVDFSAVGIGFGPFENGGGGTVDIIDEPGNLSNKVVRLVKKAGDGDYFGTTITGLSGSVVLTDQAKTITMRVKSPAIGTNYLLKLEGGPGGASTEIDVASTKANEWETLSFVMPVAGTYSTVVLFPGGRSQVGADTTMYVDDFTVPSFSGSGGGGGGSFAGVFASDYQGDLFVNSKTDKGGDVGFFFDQRLVDTKAYDYAGLSGFAQNAGGIPNFYFGLGLNAPAITDAYFGAFVKAPSNGSVNVASYPNLKLTVWGPDQLFRSGNFPQLRVVLQGPAVGGCTSASGGSEVEVAFQTTTQGAASTYTLPLSNFTLKAACNGETTVAQVLANIAQLNILLLNNNIQYVTKDPDGTAFTNGLNVGPIRFE